MNDDLILIKGILKGDIYSFEELVLRYEQGILNFTYNLTGSRQGAEELTQDVFITVYNKLYSFDMENKFTTWLYRIARNKCIDYLRKHKKNDEVSLGDMEVTSREESPEGYVLYKETKGNIQDFLKTLKPLDREILILRYSHEKLTFHDIAELLHMSEAAVKKRYYKIYDCYEKYVGENKSSNRNVVEDFSKGGIV